MFKVSKPVAWALPVIGLLAFMAIWIATQKHPEPARLPAPAAPSNDWQSLLKSDDPHERRRAAERLGGPGQDADIADKVLVPALKDPDKDVRWLAARSLLQLDRARPKAVPVLLQALRDPSTSFAVARAMTKMGSSALPALGEAMKDPQPAFRKQAASLLGDLGTDGQPSAAHLIALLRDQHPEVRQEAARSLGKIAAIVAVGPLIDALAEPDLVVVAAEALGQIGTPAVAPLLTALQDKRKPARWAMARALSLHGAQGQPAEPVLAACLTEEDRQVRVEAARTLVYVGGDVKPALPVLFQGLQDRQFRWDAIAALVRVGEPAVATLVQALQDMDEIIRGDVARSLGELGSRSAVPALSQALNDPDKSVRREAVAALGRIGAKDAVPAMLALLKDPDALNRGEVALAFARLGPAAVSAVPGLIANLADEDQNVHQETVKALVAIGTPAVPALKASLGHEVESIRRSVGEVLKQIK